MIGIVGRRRALRALGLAFAVLTARASVSPASAGEPWLRRPAPRYTVTSARSPASEPVRLPGTLNSYGSLGTFYPTPYVMVRGNAPVGGGYSPLGSFGNTTLALYGPLSSFRMTSAPVTTYTRGYDGRTVLSPGNSFSAPNLPALTPVVYPSQASYYYGFRQSGTPPWWANGMDWVDQN